MPSTVTALARSSRGSLLCCGTRPACASLTCSYRRGSRKKAKPQALMAGHLAWPPPTASC